VVVTEDPRTRDGDDAAAFLPATETPETSVREKDPAWASAADPVAAVEVA
jgi:hypothetical protein